jgi:hypothetical protein
VHEVPNPAQDHGNSTAYSPARQELLERLVPLLSAAGLLFLYGYLSSTSDPSSSSATEGAILCSIAGALGSQLRSAAKQSLVGIGGWRMVLMAIVPPILGAAFGASVFYLTIGIVVIDDVAVNVRGLSLLVIALTYALDALARQSVALAADLEEGISSSVSGIERAATSLEKSVSDFVQRTERSSPRLVGYSGYTVVEFRRGEDSNKARIAFQPEPPDYKSRPPEIAQLLKVDGDRDAAEIEFEIQVLAQDGGHFSPDRVVLAFDPSSHSGYAEFGAPVTVNRGWVKVSQLGRTVQLFPFTAAESRKIVL